MSEHEVAQRQRYRWLVLGLVLVALVAAGVVGCVGGRIAHNPQSPETA
ncbi:hypothetical protein [Nocardia pseudovaccinii]|nr:hypothetical protein [Nocardia pseudovaccinii]